MSPPPPTALVIEDDPQIRRFVRLALVAEGWRVLEAGRAAEGLASAGTGRPDLILLDLGLPDADGLELLAELRAFTGAPVIVLSARAQETDKVAALDAGADDYLAKPFGIAEMLARARASQRRRGFGADTGGPETAPGGLAAEAAAGTLAFGGIRLDATARRVTREGMEVHLTPIEYRLLLALAAHPDRVLTQRQLLRDVWGPAYVERTHYLRVHMGHLRHKLEADPAQPRHLRTEPGVGYRLVP